MFFFIETLGCKLNQLESESFIDALNQAGYKQLINDNCIDCPSIIIINTCTVTSKADQKARRVIRKALRDYPDSHVIVTGCYAQLDKEEILRLEPDCNHRVSVIGKNNILEFINNINKTDFEKINNDLNPPHTAGDIRGHFIFNPEKFSSHTRSFIKIQDGCDNKCTYCRIRLARGPSISLEADEVLSRLKVLEKNHVEAVLTGVNICQYKDLKNFYHKPHEHIKCNLTDLIAYLLKNTDKIALRLSSLEPEYIEKNFCDVLFHKRIRPHFHLSIQTCSSQILKKMGRCYDAKTIIKAVNLLRQTKDDPFIACDIIAGFPGETELEFNETFNLCRELDFAWIHVFPYSKRPGTAAFSFPDNVHDSEKTRRVQLFTDLAKKGKKEYVQRWLGRVVDILVEKPDSSKSCSGVSENYLKIQIQHNDKKAPLPGTVLRCKLLEYSSNSKYDVIAQKV